MDAKTEMSAETPSQRTLEWLLLAAISSAFVGWYIFGRRDDRQKQAKFEREKDEIEALKVEAGERLDHAMASAINEMVVGIVSCCAAAAACVAADGSRARVGEGFDQTMKVVTTMVDVGSKVLSTVSVQSIAEDRNWGDKQTKESKKSDELVAKILDKEIMINRAGVTAMDSTEAARDRKKAGMDALQKFLDILRSMNPPI